MDGVPEPWSDFELRYHVEQRLPVHWNDARRLVADYVLPKMLMSKADLRQIVLYKAPCGQEGLDKKQMARYEQPLCAPPDLPRFHVQYSCGHEIDVPVNVWYTSGNLLRFVHRGVLNADLLIHFMHQQSMLALFESGGRYDPFEANNVTPLLVGWRPDMCPIFHFPQFICSECAAEAKSKAQDACSLPCGRRCNNVETGPCADGVVTDTDTKTCCDC